MEWQELKDSVLHYSNTFLVRVCVRACVLSWCVGWCVVLLTTGIVAVYLHSFINVSIYFCIMLWLFTYFVPGILEAILLCISSSLQLGILVAVICVSMLLSLY